METNHNCRRQFDKSHRRLKAELRKGLCDVELVKKVDEHDEHLSKTINGWKRRGYYSPLQPIIERILKEQGSI